MTGPTPGLAGFVRARLDERAQIAQSARPPQHPDGTWHVYTYGGGETVQHWYLSSAPVAADTSNGWAAPALAHIAANDPARVLAEVAALRQVIDRFEGQHWHAPPIPGSAYPELREEETRACRTCITLRILAAPDAAHPDYRPEWALEGTPDA